MAQSRRTFLHQTSTLATGLVLIGSRIKTSAKGSKKIKAVPPQIELPQGEAPRALSFSHFPNRLHAFVWRNWPLVPLDRMARVIGATRSDIKRIGHAMGLRQQPRITEDQRARSYITVIKRNWHLLPYEQLLELLGWTSEQLAYTLREDDFLFVKLGNLKPRCEKLRYEPPSQQELKQAERICWIVNEMFSEADQKRDEPLFSFIPALSKASRSRSHPTRSGDLRFCYSYFALYGDPLLDAKADPYPDGYLQRISQCDVTGIWLQGVLYKLALFPWQPELSADYEVRLQNLRRLVSRASKHGIKVFLYLNEPRAMPLSFFEKHPQLKGVIEGDHASLCTSHPDVARYITDSVASICREVPEIGGFFSITASENLTNCWSHGQGAKCPACSRRKPGEVIAEVNGLFRKGIDKAGVKARLLAWDWGWNDAWAGEVIQQLPSNVEVMSVSEWRLPIKRGSIQTEVGEYSISAVGPGPRARRHWELAQKRGLNTLAKIQAGNTWELSSVPYIPAVENVARHAENLHKAGIKEVMLGWTLGGYPSPNLEVVSETLQSGSAEKSMRFVAERRFGVLAPDVIKAWRDFSVAFQEFPFDTGVVYSGPQQLGPANLLWPSRTDYHASMVGFPYDDLNAWRGPYPAQTFIEQFQKVSDGFTAALKALRQAGLSKRDRLSPAQRDSFEKQCGVAEACAIHFRSVANQARFVIARNTITASKDKNERARQIESLKVLLEDEIQLARRLFQLQKGDSRLGFEASNHYFYVPVDLMEKVINCRHLLDEWLPDIQAG